MNVNIFLKGIDTEESVLAIRAKCITNLTNGTQITSFSHGGLSVTKQNSMNTRDLLQACNRFLQSINPLVYGRRIGKTTSFLID